MSIHIIKVIDVIETDSASTISDGMMIGQTIVDIKDGHKFDLILDDITVITSDFIFGLVLPLVYIKNPDAYFDFQAEIQDVEINFMGNKWFYDDDMYDVFLSMTNYAKRWKEECFLMGKIYRELYPELSEKEIEVLLPEYPKDIYGSAKFYA